MDGDQVRLGRSIDALKRQHPEWSASRCADEAAKLTTEAQETLANQLTPADNGRVLTIRTPTTVTATIVPEPTHAMDSPPDLTDGPITLGEVFKQ